MNIKEWSKQFGILPTTPTTETGAISVLCDMVEEKTAYKALYNLSDYKVGSVCGIVIWLTPTKKEINPLFQFVVELENGLYDDDLNGLIKCAETRKLLIEVKNVSKISR